MARTHSRSLDAGRLNWDSLPMKLFAGGNAKFWNPADIDFSRDRADWESLTEKLLDEKLAAMEELWSNDEADFHGRHVDFDATYSWPKPIQKRQHCGIHRNIRLSRRGQRKPPTEAAA